MHSLSTRRRGFTAAAAAAAISVAVALSAVTPAQASDAFGPGYAIKAADGLGVSHLGPYGPPGAPVPGVSGLAYCTDPTLAGPVAAIGYGAPASHDSWMTASGAQVPTTDVSQAAYVLSRYGQTTSDSQAAAVDAAVTSLLNPGTTYALPDGARARQRVTDPAVPSSVAASAADMMANAERYAGPYSIRIQPQGTLQPGKQTLVKVTLTSASGAGVSGVRLSMTGESGGKTETVTLDQPTDATGETVALVSPEGDHDVTATVRTTGLPATSLRAVTPTNPLAQRMVLAGGTSAAQGQATLHVSARTGTGHIQVTKKAAGSGKPLGGVEFAVRDDSGKTVSSGRTNSSGVWQTAGLAPGRYTLHEVQAAVGYTVAADRQVTVTDGVTTQVTVSDTAIPQQGIPAPRQVPPGVLPQTGA